LQFSCFAEDLREAVCESIEGRALFAVLQGAADDLHVMLSGKQGVDEAIEAKQQRSGRGLRLWSQMPGIGASQLKLPLEIGQGHIHIAHGHVRAGVAEQFHHGSEAHAGTKHFSSVGMPQLVGDDICGQTGRVTGQMQVIAEPGEERYSRSWPSQEPSVVRQWIQRTEEAQAMNEITNEGIDGDHTFGFEFAQRYVNRPQVWPGAAQAVIGEVDAFSDAHSGVTEQEEHISAKIVAAHELLLEDLILLCGKRPREALWSAWNILAPYQVSEFDKLVCPGQLIADGTQSDESSDAGCCSQRRSLCMQARHPSEDVRIAAQLLESSNLRVCGAEIDEEATHREVVMALGGRAECGGEGLDGAREGRCHRMLERKAGPTLHEVILGWGWMHCAAARAY
jgi:hypothetical protein